MLVMKEAGWGVFGICLHLVVQCYDSRLLMKRNLYGIKTLVFNVTCCLTRGWRPWDVGMYALF